MTPAASRLTTWFPPNNIDEPHHSIEDCDASIAANGISAAASALV
jgi:hypothetical protein